MRNIELADFIDASRQYPVSCKIFSHEKEKVVTLKSEVFCWQGTEVLVNDGQCFVIYCYYRRITHSDPV